jgi:hypothetical protein
MPEQKGKRRKPQRRGARSVPGPAYTEPSPEPATRSGMGRPRRAGWNAPLWINIPVGIAMLIAGVYFGLLQSGSITGPRIFLLVAYLGVGVWYLYRASIQIRARM